MKSKLDASIKNFSGPSASSDSETFFSELSDEEVPDLSKKHGEKIRHALESGEMRFRTIQRPKISSGSLFENVDKPSLDDLYVSLEEVHKIKTSTGYKALSTFTGSGGSDTGLCWGGIQPLGAVEFVHAAREALVNNHPGFIIAPEMVLEWVRKDWPDVPFNKEKKRSVLAIPKSVDWIKVFSSHQDKVESTLEKLNKKAVKAFKKSGKEFVIWGDDVRVFTADAFMGMTKLKPGELDVLEGSPPCSSFSVAGKGSKGWGQVKQYSDEREQRTDDLFGEYLRLIEDLRPKVFIAENVPGLVRGKAVKVFNAIREEMISLGYRVEAEILDASRFGVPQSRRRLFIMGVRDDLVDKDGNPIQHEWPEPWSTSYTLGEALEAAGESSEETKKEMAITGVIGDLWEAMEIGDQPIDHAFQLVKCRLDHPALTITAKGQMTPASASPSHPTECRKFTAQELQYICGYPAGYEMIGDEKQKTERYGRSVPPFLMKQIAESIVNMLDKVA